MANNSVLIDKWREGKKEGSKQIISLKSVSILHFSIYLLIGNEAKCWRLIRVREESIGNWVSLYQWYREKSKVRDLMSEYLMISVAQLTDWLIFFLLVIWGSFIALLCFSRYWCLFLRWCNWYFYYLFWFKIVFVFTKIHFLSRLSDIKGCWLSCYRVCGGEYQFIVRRCIVKPFTLDVISWTGPIMSISPCFVPKPAEMRWSEFVGVTLTSYRISIEYVNLFHLSDSAKLPNLS